MAWDTDWRTAMFPKLQRKLVFLYTLSTGLIITSILSITFLFYFTSQENRQESLFQKHLFTLMFQLQGNSHFTDLFLAQMEEKNQLIIHIEENNSPLFFPGSYETGDSSFICRKSRRQGRHFHRFLPYLLKHVADLHISNPWRQPGCLSWEYPCPPDPCRI